MQNTDVLLIQSLVIAIFLLSGAHCAFSSITNGAVEDTVNMKSYWHNGGSFSDGKRFVLVDYANCTMLLFNNVPTGAMTVDSCDVKITGFTTYLSSPCIIGDKLLVCDYDTIVGPHIKVWNQVPDTNTIASSHNYKITGFTGAVYNIRTDGTRFCAISGGTWIWSSVPDGQATTLSASGYINDGINGWFGTSGKFYIVSYWGGQDTYYVYIYNSVPIGTVYSSDANARITLKSWWAYTHDAVEIRNILYVFAQSRTDTQLHAYIWKTIPASNTDTSTMDNNYALNQNMYYFNGIADHKRFYLWDGALGLYSLGYRNDYDTFTAQGSDIPREAVNQRTPNVTFYKVRIYTYPGKARLTAVKLQLTGNCSDADVSAVKVYYDADNNGVYSAGDVLLGSGTFSGKYAVIGNLNTYIDAGEKNVLITYDISASGTVGNTVGAKVVYLIFENRFYEYPSPEMTSSLSSIASAPVPEWSRNVKINYTARNLDIDTQFSVSLSWDEATGGVPPLTYKLTHLIDDSASQEYSETNASKTISNLDSSKQHKFVVKVVDSYGSQTQESDYISDAVSPEWSKSFNIKDSSKIISADKWEYRIKAQWEIATDNTSRDILYEVWTKTDNSGWTLTATTWDKEAEISNLSGIYYIKIRARDSAGNYTEFSGEKKIRMNPFLVIGEEGNIGPGGGSMTLTDVEGDRVIIEIPEGALDGQYQIRMEKILDSEYTYKFGVYDTNGKSKYVIFKKPVGLKFYYNTGKLARIGYQEDNLRIYYSDGARWTDIGGEINKNEKYVKANVKRFSLYRLSGERSNVPQGITVIPESLTPNGDDVNDVMFMTPNWNYAGDLSVKIYDIDGRQVWEYSGRDSTLIWNCRNADGRCAESGMYLYVIKAEKKIFTGTVVVVK